MKRKIVCILIIVFTSQWTFGQENKSSAFTIKTLQEGYDSLNKYLNVLEDRTNTFNIEDVLSSEIQKKFIPYEGSETFGNSGFTYWAKLKIHSSLNAFSSWALQVGNWRQEFTDVYILDESRTIIHKKSGFYQPLLQKDIPQSKESVVRLDLLPKHTYTIYIKICNKRDYTPAFIVKMISLRSFYHRIHLKDAKELFFQGLFIILTLYSLLFFVLTKEFIYLFYCCCVFLLSVFFLTEYLIIELFFPKYPFLHPYIRIFSSQGHAIFYLYFIQKFINTRRFLPKWDRFITVWILMRIGILFISLVYYHCTWNLKLVARVVGSYFLMELVLHLILSVNVFQIRKKNKLVLFFVSGYLFYGVFMAIGLGGVIYFHQPIEFFYWNTQTGALLEVIIFGVGLGYHIRRNNEEKQRAQKNLIIQLQENAVLLEEQRAIQDNYNRELEENVRERTAQIENQKEEIIVQRDAIAQQKKELEEVNAAKDRFFSIMAHDIKGPISSLTGFTTLITDHVESLSKEEIKKLGNDLSKSTANLYKFLENILYWARSQTGKIKYNFKKVNLKTLVDESVQLLEASANIKDISLECISEKEEVWTILDQPSISTVIRNLISNAIKFTREKGNIQVYCVQNQNGTTIIVEDDGVGMDEATQEKIFRIDTKHSTKGTANENGTGLGLVLCKEFVEGNGGQIWVKSERGKGSKFGFTIPNKELSNV